MLRQTLATLALALCIACGTAEQPAEQLFNGTDLTGWRHVGRGEFTVEDGALTTSGGMGLLVYDGKKIGNAVLRVVYKPESPKSNAGVFIRAPEQPHDPWFAVHKGYEVQIEDGTDEFHRTGSIYSLSPATEFPASEDGWNTMEITLDGQVTRVSVNGRVVNEFDGTQEVPERKRWFEPQRGPRPDSGYIGLQNHDQRSIVRFREVSVRPLAD
ncbi:MAG: DUF1080 domain-containing protein [Acidobacteriia bacterium]|nr:DUF1080 domain-containing protein [Terriglobia bacterium]MYG02200.1 DUF1080 domain-containing protein [Terriglobia bacterium]MYK11078.1 DUF1080 domain-containing protein [Terriglobia bacterium]